MNVQGGGRETYESGIGSDAAIQALHNDLVGALALYCGDQGTAEDCAQEALIRLWMHADTVDDARAWVFRCGFNITNSWFRRKIAERRAITRLGDRWSDESADPSTTAEMRFGIRSALTELSTRQREAIILHYLCDMDVMQVSSVMGCRSGTVKSHLARGLAALRRSGVLSAHTDAGKPHSETPDERIAHGS